ncbi:sulfurtransferase complex subunit TusD [Shewanella sp. SW32]|uniref:sulfurtransferase complex subunit TusD n=1 Tax=unclassified Shewanella TaxID=196818 RepID=UPI0021D8556C|nr:MULTISPECIES: sulfurtransferase complex subunit TusD [unclassified Shewanella]MCU7964661.1 sulfurtransferase complex subunit TusD [Shewanella sp. SW32]MCU7972586.1 sulfurtransferase complex subunit TusD [Shewanella sp. SW29]
MSKFIIQVNGPAYGTSASVNALRFSQAVLLAGHQIICVFFYQDGVYNSTDLSLPASDENDVISDWKQLAQSHQAPLVNCVSAALRRGIVSHQDASENGLSHWNVGESFIMGGLGELITGIESADRLISF